MPGTTSTALSSFSHDQHHESDAAKRKGEDTEDRILWPWPRIVPVLALAPRWPGLGLDSRWLWPCRQGTFCSQIIYRFSWP